MKVEKIPPPNIPKSHYRWAGIDTEEEKKKEKNNDLDPKKIDKLVKRVYFKSQGNSLL